MTINYTTLLGLAQPVTGTEANTWGTVVNDEITALIEEAVAGGETIDVTSGNVTLTDTDGVANQARNAILLITGTPGTTRNVVAPSTSKVYIVRNGSNGAIVLKGSATTGVTIPAGGDALCFWNGSDFEIGTTFTTILDVDNLRLDGNTISSTDTNGNIVLAPNGTGQVTVDGLIVGQGAGNVATNTAVGSAALAANTTGANNVAVGYQALDANTIGINNSAVGVDALGANTEGKSNIAIGRSALLTNTTGNYNIAVGARDPGLYAGALQANTTGSNNVAMGTASLGVNTTGSSNVGLGMFTLNANTTASNNTGVGFNALFANTTGANNTAVGSGALDANTTGTLNVGVGPNALGANTTGTGNVALGNSTLDTNTTGGNNVGIGNVTLDKCTTGSNNVAVGTASLYELTTGSQNVAIGDDANLGLIFTVVTENNRGIFGHNAITNAYVKVAWTVTSDARDKTSIKSVPHGLSFVQQLNPVSYRWKTSREDDTPHGNRRYGFLAQEVMALEGDNPVIIDNEQPDHLKYQGEALVPVLVNAIKELSAQVTALQAEVNTLKGN